MPVTSPTLQPLLQNTLVRAEPLKETDFEDLYQAASDPLIWAQHPNKNRYERNEFANYFKGGMESGGAFIVKDTRSNEIIGSSRYYDYHAATNTISIGYTFFIRSHWGTGHNYALKKLMLDHIFQFTDTVNFYIGALNKRSQVSIEKFGAVLAGEEEVAYYGETSLLNFIYTISKTQWIQLRGALKEY